MPIITIQRLMPYIGSPLLTPKHDNSDFRELQQGNLPCANPSSLYELQSKLLLSPSISPIILRYVMPYITPFKEFGL